ncbi:hypothetical protein MNBD_NITROSPINAE01-1016 [hydrothermal vent metagenome]|uniref:Glycosyl transferase family 1 domain-containing protein n=1 Tax=hydrothermal vent metagenome TaxID=652676 RepID=A0A3B1BGC9_9ZZZZ
MKIHQMLPNYWYGDAIGNHVIEIRNILREMGCESEIYANVIHEKLTAKSYLEFEAEKSPDTWVIYHYSTGSPLNQYALENVDNLILLYHNITPAKYFEPFDYDAAETCKDARALLPGFAKKVKLAIAVSEYNAAELESVGFGNVVVAPLILNFDKIKSSGFHPFEDDKTNILFVGRVAPHKGHEDLLKVFYFYRNYVDKNSRLVIVGSYDKNGSYYQTLKKYIDTMNLTDVVFTGSVPDDELGGYFEDSSIFLCLSKHEGFCVPLMEAMKFKTPVVALAESGVTNTMGYAGVLLNHVNHAQVAETLGIIKEDETLREKIKTAQTRRVHDFDRDKMVEKFKNVLTQAIDGLA